MFRDLIRSNARQRGYAIESCAQALLAIKESDLNLDAPTSDQVQDDLLKALDEPVLPVMRDHSNPDKPYTMLLKQYVDDRDLTPFEKNEVLCRTWDENMPPEPDDSVLYAKRCKEFVKECARNHPDYNRELSALHQAIEKSENQIQAFEGTPFSQTVYKEGVKGWEDLSKERNNESFQIINEKMKTTLPRSIMESYNMAVFNMPLIEDFHEKVQEVLSSPKFPAKNQVAASLATATYEAAMDSLIPAVDAETILHVLEEVSMNEFTVGAMMPVLGSTEGWGTKLAKTPIERVVMQTEKQIGKGTDLKEKLEKECEDYTESFLEYVSKIMSSKFNSLEDIGVYKESVDLEKLPKVDVPELFETSEYGANYVLGFTMLEQGFADDSIGMHLFTTYSGLHPCILKRAYFEATEEDKSNGIFENEAKKIYNKLFPLTGEDAGKKDLIFEQRLSPDKSHLAIYLKEKGQKTDNTLKNTLAANGYKRIQDPKITGEKYEKKIRHFTLEALYEPDSGRLMLSYRKEKAEEDEKEAPETSKKDEKAKPVKEAAGVDDDILPFVRELNKKGYRVKYSCAGHEKSPVKSDPNKDGVKNGKLYTTARITFDGLHHFKNIPDHWRLSEKDNQTTLFVKNYTYGEHQGNPDTAFKKWKEMYLMELRKWVSDLPKIGTDKPKETETEKEEEPVKEMVSLDQMFQEMYYGMG